jgi:membrane-associated protease RseP (regulator of RpoE activity)
MEQVPATLAALLAVGLQSGDTPLSSATPTPARSQTTQAAHERGEEGPTQDLYGIGITVVGRDTCPLIVWAVMPFSPGSLAGVQVGDHLLEIEGKSVRGLHLAQVAALLRSDRPGAVTLGLSRHGKEYAVTTERESVTKLLARAGKRLVAGAVVPAEATSAEIQQLVHFDQSRVVERAFPLHYPADGALYCGAFEVFSLRDPEELVVGGIEAGPAFRAGVRWGDRILSVNGLDPLHKRAWELERIFSSAEPSVMRLRLERLGAIPNVQFQLERAADILAANGMQLVDAQVIPLGVDLDDARCVNPDRQ